MNRSAHDRLSPQGSDNRSGIVERSATAGIPGISRGFRAGRWRTPADLGVPRYADPRATAEVPETVPGVGAECCNYFTASYAWNCHSSAPTACCSPISAGAPSSSAPISRTSWKRSAGRWAEPRPFLPDRHRRTGDRRPGPHHRLFPAGGSVFASLPNGILELKTKSDQVANLEGSGTGTHGGLLVDEFAPDPPLGEGGSSTLRSGCRRRPLPPLGLPARFPLRPDRALRRLGGGVPRRVRQIFRRRPRRRGRSAWARCALRPTCASASSSAILVRASPGASSSPVITGNCAISGWSGWRSTGR